MSPKHLLMIFLLITTKSQPPNPDPQEPERPSGTATIKFTIETADEYPIAPIKIGDPPQELNLILDIGAERTWVHSNTFKSSQSKTYSTDNQLDERTQDTFSYRGYRSKETFKLENKTLEEFLFLLVDKVENNNKFNGVLSLGREYDTKYFSIVYRLSSTMATFYNSFVLAYNSNNKTGELHVGDVTEEIRHQRHKFLPCRLLDGQPKIKWKCMLTHVFIGGVNNAPSSNDDYYEQKCYEINSRSYKIEIINLPVYFETIYNKIYVPRSFIDYMKMNLFVDNTGKSICSLEDNNSKAYFKCPKSDISKIQRLDFVLSDITDLSFPYNNMFECDDSNCISIIQYDSRFKDAFIFGLPILKNYQMIFDYNSRHLQFYSIDNKYLVKMPNTGGFDLVNFLLYFFLFIIAVLLAGICLIYVMRRKNKRRKQIEEEIYENF